MTDSSEINETSETESAPAMPRPSRVYGWFITAFGLATIVGMLAMPVLAGPPKDGAVSQWVEYLGRFHFVVLHLPIGMLSLVILMELGKLFRRNKGNSTLVPAFFTAASAVVAVIVGFLLYQSGNDNSETLQDHMWWSIGFAATTIAAFLVKNWVELAGGKGNFLYLLILLGSAGVMTVASHDGGESVHGKSYLRKEEPPQVREWINQIPGARQLPIKGEEESTKDGDEAEEPEESESGGEVAVPFEEQVVYAHIVQPIFDAKCVSCHGEDKQKGKMRMDSYAAALKGGKEGEGFEPGNADDSNMMFRIHLPLDDDERMPPEDKEQLTEGEIAILEWWIDSGASPDAKVADLEMPDGVKSAIEGLAVREVKGESDGIEEEKEKEKADEVRKELSATVEKLRSDFPTGLNFESQKSDRLAFTAVSMRGKFTDEHLEKLRPVMPSIVSLDLSATRVGDKGVAVIGEAKELRMLRLSETEVTDAALETLAGLVNLESLNLYGTAVTADGVGKLVGLPKLERLYLWQTQVDEEGVESLRKQMPDCEIVMGL